MEKLIFGDALSGIDTGGLNLNLLGNINELISDQNNTNNTSFNAQNNNNNNNNNNNSNYDIIPSLDNESENRENHDENDLGVDVIYSDENEKIYKLTDLIIPLYDNKKELTENYLRKIIEKVKKDKNEKNEKEDMKKREKNEKEEILKLMKRSKKTQKYSKVNISYDEKFFDKTLFLNKNNNEYKDNENKNNNIEEEKNKQEMKMENFNKIKINYNYDDLIKNTLLQFPKYYKNNNLDKVEEVKKEDKEEKEIKIEDEIKKDFKNKIFSKLSILNEKIKDNENDENSSNDIIKNEQGLFLGETSFFNFSKKNSELMSELITKINNHINKNNSNDNVFNFNISQSHYDKYDLQDFIKKKRNRADGYINNNLRSGAFMNSYVTNSKISKNFKENSRIIYDLNDYNMNFEIIENQKNDGNKNDNLINNSNNVITDFFSTLPKKTNYYSQNLKFGNSKGSYISHAKCCYSFTYNQVNLNYEDLADFHRPNFCKYLMLDKKKRNFSIKLCLEEDDDKNNDSKNKRYPCYLVTKAYLNQKEKKLLGKNIQYMNSYEIFKNAKKLSLADGKIALFEHIDEYPLFMANFGMANKMKKYLYSTKLFITSNNKNNNNMKLNEIEQKTLNMMGPNGSQILLKPEQKLPLLGQIDQNELKGINIIDNNMYKAPVFYEKISYPNSAINTSLDKKRYNFLITFSKNEKGQKVFHIRELEHLYTVAQEEPKVEVYPPNSRQYINFLKNKIETYTYMLYNEIGYKSGINFKIFQNLFPTVTEQVLKKIFKEMNIEIDKYICYFKKLPGDINQRRIQPENICQFESCQFGIYKLREVGIKNLTNADKISYATNKYINNKTTLAKEQYLAKVIEEQLLTTPWNITQNYLQSKQTKGMLSIKGIGDPSNGNGGYSFLKMPVKSYNENKTLKEEMDVLKNQNKNIKTVTGTDADLRKLSKEEIKIKLIQLGIEEDQIQKMGRWKRVSLLRSTSSHAVKLGYEGDIVKYARNQRYNTKTQREAYQRNINEVFKKQIDYILKADSIPLDENDSYSENVEDDNLNDISQSNQEGMRYNFEEELDNKKRNSMAFMRNEIYPNKKKK